MDSLHSVLYLTASEFFDALLEKALTRNDESCLLYEQIHQCDLLIIDDLGTERNTDFVVSQLFVCLNDRILNRKSTIISTNLTLEEIKTNYTERTFSRISNHYKILRLAGDDIRIQKETYVQGGTLMLHRSERILDNIPVGSLGIIAVDGCEEMGNKVNDYLVKWRKEETRFQKDNLVFNGYEKPNYLINAKGTAFWIW